MDRRRRCAAGLCDLAERTKKKALTLLQQPDEWKTPILIHAQSPQPTRPDAPAAQMNVSQTGFGLKLQLDLIVSAEMQPRGDRARPAPRRFISSSCIARSRIRLPERRMSIRPPGCSKGRWRSLQIGMQPASRRACARCATRITSCRSSSSCSNGPSCSTRRRANCIAPTPPRSSPCCLKRRTVRRGLRAMSQACRARRTTRSPISGRTFRRWPTIPRTSPGPGSAVSRS